MQHPERIPNGSRRKRDSICFHKKGSSGIWSDANRRYCPTLIQKQLKHRIYFPSRKNWKIGRLLKQEGTWVRWNRCTRDRILFGNENQEVKKIVFVKALSGILSLHIPDEPPKVVLLYRRVASFWRNLPIFQFFQ